MRKFIILFVSAMAYMLLSSRSCEGPEQESIMSDEEVVAATKDSIEHQFASDDLSTALLNTMEVQAHQKLADLYDYLNLYANESLDSAFRIQARLMIRKLFVSDTVQINTLLASETGEPNLPLNDYLRSLTNPVVPSPILFIDSIRTVSSLYRTGEMSYEGIIAFERQLGYLTASDTTLSSNVSMVAEMLAVKVSRAVGSDTMQVWEVLLGDIRQE